MNLPQLVDASAFERHNLVVCRATFDGDITPTVQAELSRRTQNFNQRSPGGPLKTRYLLQFTANQIIFLQGRMTEAPTRQHFDRFRQELGIVFPDDTVSTSLMTTQPARSAEATAIQADTQ